MSTLLRYPKTILALTFTTGLIAGQCNPFGWVFWKIAENRLPHIKAESLSNVSPFLSLPKEQWLLESEKVFVIENDTKLAPYHFLVVPKERVEDMTMANEETLTEMVRLINQTVARYNLHEKGFRVVINTNPQGGQSVYHLHAHILAGRQMKWPPG
jgi:histidine triad (HIT) family protein